MTAGSGKRPHVSRTGEHHTPWTTSDIRYLRENAGHVPIAELARHLKRSQQAIRSRACILGVSIRCYRRTMVWCDQCATWRTALDSDGRCPICRLRDQLQAVEGRISDELQAAPEDVRELYARTESLRASAVKSVPMGEWQEGSEYDRQRVQEVYLRNVEEAERATLQRMVDACKTRLKRIREKRGTNPRKKTR